MNRASRTPVDRPADPIAAVELALRGFRWPRGSVVVVAVSGGADSTALACATAEVAAREGWRLVLAHLHHGLRGRAADRDREFVRDLARRLGARYISRKADVRRLAEREQLSLEMAARAARRRFLLEVARRHDARAVLLGHTLDDQAETLLLRLARGTTPGGLAAMALHERLNNVEWLRPFLVLRKRSIEQWLRHRRQPWRIDATNRSLAMLRNRVRWRVLPTLEKHLNPRAVEALARLAEMAREDDEILEKLTERACGRARDPEGCWRTRVLKRLPPAILRRVLYRALVEAGVPAHRIQSDMVRRVRLGLLEKAAGRCRISSGFDVEWDAQRLSIRRVEPPPPTLGYCVRQPIPGEVRLPGFRAIAMFDRGFDRRAPPGIGHVPDAVWIDREMALRNVLIWRTWRPGDRIQPLGMEGSKKLHDLFIDTKVPRDHRRSIPLLTCGDDVIWVPGYRVARDWAAKGPDSKTVRIDLVPD